MTQNEFLTEAHSERSVLGISKEKTHQLTKRDKMIVQLPAQLGINDPFSHYCSEKRT